MRSRTTCSLLPAENATGNYRIVQSVPVNQPLSAALVRKLRSNASRRRSGSQDLTTQFLVIGEDHLRRLATQWRSPVAEQFADESHRGIRNGARMGEALNCGLVGQLRTTADSVNHKRHVVARFHRFVEMTAFRNALFSQAFIVDRSISSMFLGIAERIDSLVGWFAPDFTPTVERTIGISNAFAVPMRNRTLRSIRLSEGSERTCSNISG